MSNQKYLYVFEEDFNGTAEVGLVLDGLKDVDELLGVLNEDEVELYKIDLDETVRVSVDYDKLYKVEPLSGQKSDYCDSEG